MNKTVKIWFCVVCGVLLSVTVTSFVAACVKGCCQVAVEHPKVQVYINDNDSIVDQLQLDIKKLVELIERMESDPFAVEIRRLKMGSNVNNKGNDFYDAKGNCFAR